MSLGYTIRESFSGFKRTKLSSIISVFTISISLLLLGIFAVITINTARFIDALRTRVEMEVFLQEPLTREEIQALQNNIATMEGVETVVFVSKDEAARVFKQEFGEDITRVLDFNPLPPSFKVYLADGYRTLPKVEALHDRLMSMKGIESVAYRRALLELIDTRTAAVHNITLGLGIIISLSAIFLVSNTIRLAIYAKRKLIRTMEFVGATRWFIRLPFLLEGVMQGALGGLLAAAGLYLMVERAMKLFSVEIASFIHMPPSFYLLVIVAGLCLGLAGSVISVARFIRSA